MGRCTNAKNYLIKTAFPELERITITFQYQRSDDFFMQCGPTERKGTYGIDVDSAMRKAPDDAFIGCLAHEFCHIVEFERFGAIMDIEHVLYEKSEFYLKVAERRVDRMAVRRGFGLEMIALMNYEQTIIPESEEQGLNREEILAMMALLPAKYPQDKVRELIEGYNRVLAEKQPTPSPSQPQALSQPSQSGFLYRRTAPPG